MKSLQTVTFFLVVIGALNWGLVALFQFNLVSTLLGAGSSLEMLVYVLVGASAVYQLAMYMGYGGKRKK